MNNERVIWQQERGSARWGSQWAGSAKTPEKAFKDPVLGLPRLHCVCVSFFLKYAVYLIKLQWGSWLCNFNWDIDSIQRSFDNLTHHTEQTGPPRLVVKGYIVDCLIIKASWPLKIFEWLKVKVPPKFRTSWKCNNLFLCPLSTFPENVIKMYL